MDLSVASSSLAKTLLPPFSFSLRPNAPKRLRFSRNSAFFLRKPPSISRQNKLAVVTAIQVSTQSENDDFVLEDVPHLTNYLPDLPVLLVSPLLHRNCCHFAFLVFNLLGWRPWLWYSSAQTPLVYTILLFCWWKYTIMQS